MLHKKSITRNLKNNFLDFKTQNKTKIKNKQNYSLDIIVLFIIYYLNYPIICIKKFICTQRFLINEIKKKCLKLIFILLIFVLILF